MPKRGGSNGLQRGFIVSMSEPFAKISGRYLGVHYFVALIIEHKFDKALIFSKDCDIIFTD